MPGPQPGSLSFIYDGGHPPPPATYPPASGEQPLTAGIHGLATRGTYGRTTSLPPRWALTPPFHPYPPRIGGCADGRSFSVTLPYPHGYQVVSLRGALCCPDFPPPADGRQRQSGPAVQRYEKSSAEASDSLIMPRRSIFFLSPSGVSSRSLPSSRLPPILFRLFPSALSLPLSPSRSLLPVLSLPFSPSRSLLPALSLPFSPSRSLPLPSVRLPPILFRLFPPVLSLPFSPSRSLPPVLSFPLPSARFSPSRSLPSVLSLPLLSPLPCLLFPRSHSVSASCTCPCSFPGSAPSPRPFPAPRPRPRPLGPVFEQVRFWNFRIK